MLHPTKGEGEHQKPKNKLKGPQLITATLLFCYPLVCAQAAVAQTQTTSSSFQKIQQPAVPYDHTYSQLLGPQQRTTAFLSPLQLGMNPNLYTAKFPYFNAPSSEQEYQEMLAKASTKLAEAKAQLTKATTSLTAAQALKSTTSRALATAQATLVTAQQALQSAQTALATAKQSLANTQANSSTALQSLQEADALLIQQTQITQTAQAALDTAQTNLTSATSNLQSAQNTRTSAQANVATKQSAYAQAQQATITALAQLQTAQYNYDSSSIPNPNYVAPSYTTQPTTYQIPDNNFMTGQPWIGDGSGSQGQPEVHPGHLHFSYIPTEVYQDILLYPRQIANYDFKVAIWNQDQNSVNRGAVTDTYGLRIYFYDANDNLLHQDSLTRTQAHGWQDVTLQGNTNTTTEVAKVRIGIYGIDNGFWNGTYGPAANNVRLTLGWITGTTQGSTTTGTMQVDIGEGGESTFVAPNGGIFTSSNLRYESYSDPSCGANVTPNNLGGNTIQLVADNSIWDDPCGGQSKHLVGTLTYSTSEPQFIKDASLLPAITAAQLEYDNALTAEQQALTSYQQSQDQSSSTSSAITTSQQTLEEAQAEVTSTQSAKDSAQSSFESAQSQKDETASQNNTLKAAVTSATVALAAATSDQESLTTQLNNLESDISSAEATLEDADTNVQEAQDDVTSAQEDVDDAQSELDAIPAYVAPEPEPEEEEKIELPPLEDLTKVNFEEIVATDLTEAQAEELKEAALETFETAEKGSEEYNSALEALMVAAQQNDITVDPALAEIPGVGAAVVALADAINFLGNAGADMSPQVREESEKVVVAAVVAGNAAIAAAAGAASSAASAAASSSSGPSSRKIN